MSVFVTRFKFSSDPYTLTENKPINSIRNVSTKLVIWIDVDIKKPRVCRRQTHRQNVMASAESLTFEEQIAKYFPYWMISSVV